MSHLNPADLDAAILAVADRKFPAKVKTLTFAGMGLGVLGLLYGFFGMGNAAWTSASIVVGLMYTLAMAQGGVLFAAILAGTQGRWGRPIKRVGEAFAFYMPIGYVLLVAFLLAGGVKLYPWHVETYAPTGHISVAPHAPAAIHSKELWLTPGFFIARQVIGLGLLILLDFLFLRASLRPDLIKAKEMLGAKAPAWWDRFIGGETSVEKAVDQGIDKQPLFAVLMGMAYFFVFSMLAFDLIMSLAPHWYTNMFGVWTFMSGLWLGLCTLGVYTLVGREWLGLTKWAKPNVYLDLGKLILALTMFWAYTLYAQLLPIWYADIPEETDFLMIRLLLPEWAWLARTVAVLCFITPFTIMVSRGIKKMRWPLVGALTLIMIGLFLERSLLVLPTIWLDGYFPGSAFLLVNVPVWIGLVSVFVFVVTKALTSLPALVVTDPFLDEHPWDVHVHSLDDHGHAH